MRHGLVGGLIAGLVLGSLGMSIGVAGESKLGESKLGESEPDAGQVDGHDHPGGGVAGESARWPRVPGCGQGRFPGSTPIVSAARLFEQGLGQWFGGWSAGARESFRGVVATDPHWPMGYWGLAVTTFDDSDPPSGFASGDAAVRRAAAVEAILAAEARLSTDTSDVERLMVEAAVEWSRGIDLPARDPWSILRNHPTGDPILIAVALAISEQTGGPRDWWPNSLDRILDVYPEHPLIRLRLVPGVARNVAQARAAALACGRIAPDVPSMWQASAQWWDSVGEADAAVIDHEAAVDAYLRSADRHRWLPSRVPGLVASVDALLGRWIQGGRHDDAVVLSQSLLPWPVIDWDRGAGGPPSPLDAGRTRMIEALIASGRWSELMRRCGGDDLAADETDPRWGDQWRAAAAIASFRLGAFERGQRLFESLRRRGRDLGGQRGARGGVDSDRRRAHEVLVRLVETHGQARSWPPPPRDRSEGVNPSLIWRPRTAPSWGATAADGQLVFGDQYRGRPMVVIFYLGFGCLHCVEQLHVFGAQADAFDQSGIEVIAISQETVESLGRSVANFGRPIPMPLLSNVDGEVFEAFGCVDQMNGERQHGTFYLDREGRVAWSHTGREPFMDPQRLIGEIARLRSHE